MVPRTFGVSDKDSAAWRAFGDPNADVERLQSPRLIPLSEDGTLIQRIGTESDHGKASSGPVEFQGGKRSLWLGMAGVRICPISWTGLQACGAPEVSEDVAVLIAGSADPWNFAV